MGLDMYLKVRKEMYRSGYSFGADAVKALYPKTLKECAPKNPTDLVVKTVTEYRVGYWRKANAIHKWFVDNVQSGVDDCRAYLVSLEKLQELKKLCEKVLKNHELAKIYLPTQDGFFFGNLDYDKYYFEDLEDTIKIIEPLIPAMEKLEKINALNEARLKKNGAKYVYDDPFEVYYQASW